MTTYVYLIEPGVSIFIRQLDKTYRHEFKITKENAINHNYIN
jgi:hypothetical protein